MTVVVARLLGREVFGRFGIISGTIATFAVVGTLGMGVASTKLVAQNRLKDPVRAGRSLTSAIIAAVIAGGVVALALILAAPWLAAHVLNDAGLTRALRLSACALFFIAWSSGQAGGLAGVEAFSATAWASIIAASASLVFSVIGVWRWGFIGAVAGMPFAAAVQCAIQEVALRRVLPRKGIPFTYAHPLAEIRHVVAVGFPAMLSAGLYVPASWLGSVLLVRHAGYREMAIFTVADQWFNLVLMLPVVLGSVLLPVMTNVFSVSDPDASRALLRKTFKANLAVSFLPLIVIVPFSPLLLRIYGPTYPSSWPVLCLMVAAACLVSVLSTVGHALTATGRMWLASAMNLGWSLSYLAFAYLFLAMVHKGAVGLALARLLAYGLHGVWSLVYLRAVLRQGTNGLAIRL